jgi:arylsulfatase A-like enzyme
MAAGLVQPTRPNFIVILTDDQGWASTSFRMHPEIASSMCDYLETPNMARLAEQGMRFSSGYAPAPVCTPTRRSIQFGMTPARQRGTEFVGDFHPRGHLSIPQALRRVDPRYRCAHFGKWGESISGKQGLDQENPAAPARLGYDETDGVTGNVTGGMGADNKDKLNFKVTEDPKLVFSMTKRAVGFMERQARAAMPFYMHVSYYAVHRQVQCRRETLEKYRRKGNPPRQFSHAFAAMAEDMDTGIGQLLAALDKLGLASNTYILLMADNGGATYNEYDGGGLPVNHPLRAAKASLYEGGVRVPFIVRGPGVAPRSWSHVPVAGYDILPTVYDLAGGTAPLPQEIDGGSLKPVLAGAGKGSVRRGLPGLVFHRPLTAPVNRLSALRIGDHKLVVKWTNGQKELYDLSRDIGEEHDLATKMPGRTDEMYDILTRYLKEVNAETPPEGNTRGRKR